MAVRDEIIDEIGQNEAHPLADLVKHWPCSSTPYEETYAKIQFLEG